MAKLCEGRVCIVTGAGRGIGREHALMLAAHGSKVVVNDVGGAMDGEGHSEGPAHHVLVNNAGILRDRMLVNMTEAEWDAVIKVHLKGTAAPTHFAANHWRDR